MALYSPETREMMKASNARGFIEFVHDVDALKALVMLVCYCDKARTDNEIVAYMRRRGVTDERTYDVMDFAKWQYLLIGLPDYRRKAIKSVTEEINYRIINNGYPSPQPDPEHEEVAKLVAALGKVDEVLKATGWQTRGKRRLRVIG
jgi:hypothetical protein